MSIDNKIIMEYFSDLPTLKQNNLLKDLGKIKVDTDCFEVLRLRGDALDDRRAECPHCQSTHYIKNGTDKGSRRYKCKECKRGFTEYTGTWVAGLHKKENISDFIKALEMKLSLEKSSKETGLAASTIFIWRHKFLSAHQNSDEEKTFKGITESDETFFLHSQKGKPCKHRAARIRGGRPSRGISKDEAALLTTMDRAGTRSYVLTSMGRVSMEDLEKTIGDHISDRTIICSDGLSSFKMFAKKNNLEHHVLIASKRERVKGEYHIQHVNNLHGQIKTLLNNNLRGVATKYLQKYANWQIIRDIYKDAAIWTKAVLAASMLRADALKVYHAIEYDYNQIYTTPPCTS